MTTAAPTLDRSRIVSPAPRWVLAVTFPLALIGLGISIYLTIVHFEPHALVCQNGTIFNCGEVTTSKWSRFLGIPVVFLGLFQYLVMAGLCTPWAWRSKNRLVHLARLAFAVVGMCFVLWLLSAEILLIHAFCEWCSGVHLVTFLLFICMVRTVPTMVGWAER
jgi:uncharacterized membrane protein